MFFPLTPNLVGFVNKNVLPMTSWSLDKQVPAKTVHIDFQILNTLEQYPKIKFRIRQSVRWLEHIPCLYCMQKGELLGPKVKQYFHVSFDS